MTLTIELPTELEHRIEAEAKRRGLGKDQLVRVMLEENLNRPALRQQPPFPAKIIATDLPVRDRSQEHAWLAQHRDEYDGKYVALDGSKLLAVGDGAKEVVTEARSLGINDALIVYVEGRSQLPFISGGVE